MMIFKCITFLIALSQCASASAVKKRRQTTPSRFGSTPGVQGNGTAFRLEFQLPGLPALPAGPQGTSTPPAQPTGLFQPAHLPNLGAQAAPGSPPRNRIRKRVRGGGKPRKRRRKADTWLDQMQARNGRFTKRQDGLVQMAFHNINFTCLMDQLYATYENGKRRACLKCDQDVSDCRERDVQDRLDAFKRSVRDTELYTTQGGAIKTQLHGRNIEYGPVKSPDDQIWIVKNDFPYVMNDGLEHFLVWTTSPDRFTFEWFQNELQTRGVDFLRDHYYVHADDRAPYRKATNAEMDGDLPSVNAEMRGYDPSVHAEPQDGFNYVTWENEVKSIYSFMHYHVIIDMNQIRAQSE